MKNILIVEDNEQINELLTMYIKKEGYHTFSVTTAEEGLDLFEQNKIDLVVTDLMLPKMCGEELIREIRKQSQVFVIAITAKTQIEDKLYGLQIGADDYIVKPFSYKELLLKMRNFLKRTENDSSEYLSFNKKNLVIYRNNNVVELCGTSIELTPNEYLLLKYLSEHPYRIFTRDQILSGCFNDESDVFDRVIDVYIKNIRKKIEEDSKHPIYIKTVYGLGYKFEGDKDA